MDTLVDGSGSDVGQNVVQQAAVVEAKDNPQAATHATQMDTPAWETMASVESFKDDDELSPAIDEAVEDCEPEDDGLDHKLVQQEAWAICRVRELAKACARLSGSLLPTAVRRAARRIVRCASRLGGFPPEPEPLTALEVAALQAALQEAAVATAFVHDGEPTQEGVATVEQLAQQALEGIDLSRPMDVDGPGAAGLAPWLDSSVEGSGEEGISVKLLLRAGPERVSALTSALCCLLRRTLSSRNVFAVLLLGRRLGCSGLAEQALLAAIANFPTAVRADRRHFLLLDHPVLLLITSNSHLQVRQELDVWQAIADWVQHAWEFRRDHLYDLLQAGVRLSQLDTLQLSQLQRHPLLQAEPGPAAQLVSAAYSARILSNVHQSRNRQRGTGSAAGPGPGSYGVGPGHDSQAVPRVGHPRPALPQQQLQLQQQQQAPQQHQEQAQQAERPRPHAALQQLIGSLQARAAAARARQQQLQLQQQRAQQQQQQTRLEGQELHDQAGAAKSRSPTPHLEGTPGPGTVSAAAMQQEPGSGGNAPGPATLASSDPHAGATDGGSGGRQITPRGSPSTSFASAQRRPSPGPSPEQSKAADGVGGSIGGGGAASAVKRQLASMIAQQIARAAAKQGGLPRIQVGPGGQVTPGAVQAALSAAQKQMAANPQLQEMLREARARIAQTQQRDPDPDRHPPHQQDSHQQQQPQRQQAANDSPLQLPRPPPLALPPSDVSPKPAAPLLTPSGALASSPSPGAISPGLVAQLLLPGSHPPPQPGQHEPSRLQQPPTALAPQQLLQIAAAVQKAVRSGQPQPPHVRQQLQQLQAFISRQLAATPAASQQQPLLLALQSMLAGAATGTGTGASPQTQEPAEAAPQQAGGKAGVPPGLPTEQQQPRQQQEEVIHGEGQREGSGAQGQDAAQEQGQSGAEEALAQLDGPGDDALGGVDDGWAGGGDAGRDDEPAGKRQRQQ